MSGLIKVVRKAKPFFSRVDEAAKELPRTKGTGKEFMAELKKQPGVKKAELDDRKLSELESAPKMTKQEFIQKLEKKPAPKIDESIKTRPTDVDLDERAMELIDSKADELTERKLGKRDRFNRYEWDDYQEGAVQYLKDYEYDKYLREAKRNIEENIGADLPKYEDWKLPGGENYREILLRLPEKPRDYRVVNEMGDIEGEGFLSRQSAEQYRAMRERETGDNMVVEADPIAGGYRSSHWDEPNVLAHIRVQDRAGPNGEKILHVEEIQSDWHQEGRKKGYRESAEPMDPMKAQRMKDKIFERFDAGEITREQRNALLDELSAKIDQGSKVPDAPFKKNWHELATKRIMDYAIQNGYDKVAITPGAEQASRYSLSKHIDALFVSKRPNGLYDVSGSKDGQFIFGKNNINESDLEGLIGKDLAIKSVNDLQNPNSYVHPTTGDIQKRYSDLDLTLGGEGMKGFYDQILPAYINKEYGKYGANVGSLDVTTNKGLKELTSEGGWTQAPPEIRTLHSIDITPEMRETIQNKGQPLYQATGIGLTGAAAVPDEEPQPEFRRGGRVHLTDNPDTMMLELNSRRK